MHSTAVPIDIRKLIYDATVNRKPDFVLGMDLRALLDNDDKRMELASTLLEQTFQGTIVNSQVLMYLKYCMRAELISCCGVFSSLMSFKSFSSPNTLSSLLMILEELLNKLVSTRVTDPISPLCQSLIILTQWFFNALCHIIQQVLDQPEMWNHQGNNVEIILRNLNRICNENKCTCLLFIACAEESHQWSNLTQEFHAVANAVQRLTSSQQLPQAEYQIRHVLKQVEDTLPLFQDKQGKLRYLLSKDIETPFPVNYRISLELMLSHRKSVLFSNSSPDAAFQIISEIQSCLHLSTEDTVKVILAVGLDAINYEEEQYKWGAIFFVRIPGLLHFFLPKLLNGFYPILIDFMNEKRVRLNQSQKLRGFFESFITAIMEAQLISVQEAEGIIPFQRENVSSLLGEVTAAKNHVDKIISARTEKVQKLVDLIEKSPSDFDCVLYCAAASGRLTQLTSIILNIALQEQNKDAIFGICFLVIFRMISLFGQRTIFKVVALC